MAYIVVDESNAELEWILGQKEEYKILGNLRNQYIDVTWIVLTSIADFQVNIKIIIEKFVYIFIVMVIKLLL